MYSKYCTHLEVDMVMFCMFSYFLRTLHLPCRRRPSQPYLWHSKPYELLEHLLAQYEYCGDNFYLDCEKLYSWALHCKSTYWGNILDFCLLCFRALLIM